MRRKRQRKDAAGRSYTQLADTDPLLRCEVDSITHEIILSFWAGCSWRLFPLLSEKYKLETVVKEPSVIYMERPLKAASHTIHISAAQPVLGIHGLSVTPLSLGSGVQYESRVSLGYLNQSFQNAVRDGIRYGLEQGLFGWNVTDCKDCFEYGLYYSPVSTPADFRSAGPDCIGTGIEGIGDAAAGTLSLPSSSMRPRNTFPGLIMMHQNTVPPSIGPGKKG